MKVLWWGYRDGQIQEVQQNKRYKSTDLQTVVVIKAPGVPPGGVGWRGGWGRLGSAVGPCGCSTNSWPGFLPILAAVPGCLWISDLYGLNAAAGSFTHNTSPKKLGKGWMKEGHCLIWENYSICLWVTIQAPWVFFFFFFPYNSSCYSWGRIIKWASCWKHMLL